MMPPMLLPRNTTLTHDDGNSIVGMVYCWVLSTYLLLTFMTL